MGCIGGKDVASTTRNVLRCLMTNGVAAKMNFAGRGGKTAIQNMILLKAIIGKTTFSPVFIRRLTCIILVFLPSDNILICQASLHINAVQYMPFLLIVF